MRGSLTKKNTAEEQQLENKALALVEDFYWEHFEQGHWSRDPQIWARV